MLQHVGRQPIDADGAEAAAGERPDADPPAAQEDLAGVVRSPVGDHVIEAFRVRADAAGRGYQTMINDALREYLGRSAERVDAATIRRIVREELQKTG